jgi:hypothetical protein
MADISVLSKRTFCFFHPDVSNSEAMQKAMANREHNKPLPGSFTTKALPFQAQPAPDWIVDTPLFKLAEKDGDIFVVPTPGVVSAPLKESKPVDTTGGDFIRGQATTDQPPVDLTAMTKQEIIDHAAEVHGLELNPGSKKDELIAAVQEAQTKAS